jgi:hypothetical protein
VAAVLAAAPKLQPIFKRKETILWRLKKLRRGATHSLQGDKFFSVPAKKAIKEQGLSRG